MPKRRRGNTVEKWEISLIKAMLAHGGYNDQEILAYFTRPTRSVNYRAIGEIHSHRDEAQGGEGRHRGAVR
jgi:hypothetical protein